MGTYNETITEFDVRKEFLSEVAKTESADIAIDAISDLSAVDVSTPRASAVEEGNIEILSRLDTPRTMAAETKEQKTEVPSLTDIIINQPEEEASVRRSKHIQSRNVEENSKKKKENDELKTD